MIRKYFRLKHFAKLVANYIFACDCEDDVFVELSCRKLKDLGLVKLVNVWHNETDHTEYYEKANEKSVLEDFSSGWFFYGVWFGIAICGVCVYFFG